MATTPTTRAANAFGLPIEVGVGWIRGTFVTTQLEAVGDPETVSGEEVIGVPVTGAVRITARPNALLDAGGTPPLIILPQPLVVTLDENGELYVGVVPTDDPALNPIYWTYHLDFDFRADGAPLRYPSFDVAVPTGQIVDLARVAPIPGTGGAVTIVGPQGTQGPPGPPGPPGYGIGILGTFDDPSELPETGNTPGDAYLIGGDLWVWDGTAWTDAGPVQGPPGPSGVTWPSPVVDSGGQVFNVKAYGAAGDGTTDDTAAIQATVYAAKTVGGAIYFPAGSYRITESIDLTEWSFSGGPAHIYGPHVYGAGLGATQLLIALTDGPYPALDFCGSQNAYIHDLVIWGNPGLQSCYVMSARTTTRNRGDGLRMYNITQSNNASSICCVALISSDICKLQYCGLAGPIPVYCDPTNALGVTSKYVSPSAITNSGTMLLSLFCCNLGAYGGYGIQFEGGQLDFDACYINLQTTASAAIYLTNPSTRLLGDVRIESMATVNTSLILLNPGTLVTDSRLGGFWQVSNVVKTTSTTANALVTTSTFQGSVLTYGTAPYNYFDTSGGGRIQVFNCDIFNKAGITSNHHPNSNGNRIYQYGGSPWTFNPGILNEQVFSNGNHMFGATGSVTTTATAGYLTIPTCAGHPTGVPSVGGAAIVFDTTTPAIWFRNPVTGAWQGVGVANTV